MVVSGRTVVKEKHQRGVCVSMVWGCEESRGAEHEVRGMHFMPQALLSFFRAGHIGSAEEQGAIRRPHFLHIDVVTF